MRICKARMTCRECLVLAREGDLQLAGLCIRLHSGMGSIAALRQLYTGNVHSFLSVFRFLQARREACAQQADDNLHSSVGRKT
jgi:hypothetical protein